MKAKDPKFVLLATVIVLLLAPPALPAMVGGSPAAPAQPFASLSVGGGYGLNYGGIGLGFEFNPRLPARFGSGIHRYASIALGVGYWPAGGVAYSFGIHAYPLGRSLFLQPRLSVQYGVIAVIEEYFSGDERRAEGVACGAGFLLRVARQLLLDADVHYIIPVDYPMDDLVGGRVRVSAGVRYRLQ